MKQKLSFTFLVIFLFGCFLRFYQLGNIPPGLNQDETAIGYNAYSILQTGRDEHGITFPLYFKSFNDYKLPVYIYMTALVETVFGVTSFAVRFSSAFFGSLAIIGLFLLIMELGKNKNLALLSAFLLAINPWHVFFSRVGLEVNVAVTFSLFGVLFFIYAQQRKNNLLLYILSLLCFMFSIYTYNITRVFAPILLLILIILLRKSFFAMEKWKIFILVCLFIIIEIPFALTLLSHSGFTNQQNVMITGGDAKASNIEFRSYLVGLPHIFTAIFFNSFVLLIWQYCKNIVASLSTTFFFTSAGLQTGDINVGDLGMFYPIEFFTIIIGFLMILKQKVSSLYIFIFWSVALILFVSLSAVVPTGTRNFAVVIPLIVFSAFGLLSIHEYIKKHYRKYYPVVFAFIIVSFAYGFMYFQTSYYNRFPIAYAEDWRSEDKDLALYLQQVAPSFNHIIIDRKSTFIYTSLAFYQKYPPAQFQKDVIYEPDSLFTNIEKLGKYSYRKINWTEDLKLKNTLFVTQVDNLPPGINPDRIFYYPTRPVVLSLNNAIAQYPYTKPAFAIVMTK